jgi:hypothetical protein
MTELTLRILHEKLRKQSVGCDWEKVLDMPLTFGVHDGHLNFDHATAYDRYPRVTEPRAPKTYDADDEGTAGCIRIDCYLNVTRLVKDKK